MERCEMANSRPAMRQGQQQMVLTILRRAAFLVPFVRRLRLPCWMLVKLAETLKRRAAEWISGRWKLLLRAEIRRADRQEFLREGRGAARLRV
jgi:hypothetical protein